jgi:hypothetical protein
MRDCPLSLRGVHNWKETSFNDNSFVCEECGQLADEVAKDLHTESKLTGASNTDFDMPTYTIPATSKTEWEEMKKFETSSTGGTKEVKLARFDLIPVEALRVLAEIYGKGALKYEEHNWRRGYRWSLSYAAAQRHMNAFWNGEEIDPESGQPHLLHAAWHMFALYIFTIEKREFDNRYGHDTDAQYAQGHFDFGGVSEGADHSTEMQEG